MYPISREMITMNINRWLRWREAPFQEERGIGLAEVLVAVAILGVAFTALLSSMNTGSNAVIITDKRVTARNLAEAQIEHIKALPYHQGDETYSIIETDDTNYTISLAVGTISANSLRGTTFIGATIPGTQTSIQQIMVTVSRAGSDIIELTTFKGNR